MGNTAVKERKPADAGGKKVKQAWWVGGKMPRETTTIQLAKARVGFGGDYLLIWVGDNDGEVLVRKGIKLLALESIKKRIVTLTTKKEVDGTRGWHKVRITPTMRPHVHFPVEEGKFRTVESKADLDEIELKIEDDKVTFELPASIR